MDPEEGFDNENEADVAYIVARNQMLARLGELRPESGKFPSVELEKRMTDITQAENEQEQLTLELDVPVENLTKEDIRSWNQYLSANGWRSTWEPQGGTGGEGAMRYTNTAQPGQAIVVSKRGKYVLLTAE